MIRIAAACLLAALWLAGPAPAKEVSTAKVCGADACTEVDDRAALRGFAEGGEPTDGPGQALPFYRVRLGVGDGRRVHDRFTVVYVPKASLIRGEDGTWMPVGRAFWRSFRSAIPPGRPFPPSQLDGAGAVVPVATPVVDAVYSFGGDEPGGSGSGWLLAALLALLALAALAAALTALRRGAGFRSRAR